MARKKRKNKRHGLPANVSAYAVQKGVSRKRAIEMLAVTGIRRIRASRKYDRKNR